MKNLFLCGAVTAVFALPALAQPRAATQNAGLFSLPPGVTNVVAIDAHNTLLVETEDFNSTRVTEMPIRHLYAGGVARLLGGTVVPTLPFISPGTLGGQNGGGNGGSVGVTTTTGNGGFGGNGNNGNGNNATGNTRFGAVTRTGAARVQTIRGGAR